MDETIPIIHLAKAFKQARYEDTRNQHAESICEVLSPQLQVYAPKLYSLADFGDFEIMVLEGVLAGLENFRGETDQSFYAWFNQIAWHKTVDLNRKQERHRKLFDPLPIEEVQET